ncbi:MAG: transglutaminase-like domain-containing protein [archaeon]
MDEFEEDEKGKSPIIYIIAVFLILLMVVTIVPLYNIKIDPRPSYIPTVEEVFLFQNNISTETVSLKSREDFLNFVVPESPIVKTTANRIVTLACEENKICNAKVIYYFVRDNFQYISDPVNFEYVELPQDFIVSGGGDCESGTLLMANLMEAVGIDSQLVFIPNHAFLRIRLPDAKSRYRLDEQWVYLDWTCSYCDFGETPINNINAEKQFLDVY